MKVIISTFFHIISTMYIYKKLLKCKNSTFSHLMQTFILLIIFISLIIIQQYSPLNFSFIFILIISIFFTCIYNTKLDTSLITAILSHFIFRVACNITSFFLTILCIPLYYAKHVFPGEFLVFATGLLSCIFIHFILKIKYLKSGMSFLNNRKFFYIVFFTFIAIIVLKLLDATYITHSDFLSALPLRLATILLALLLFTWWRKQITKSYIEKLRKLEVQSLYDELEEKERQIQKLVADNESLSRIIHKDNKLIPAMENAVINFLSTEDFHNPDKLKQYGLELTQKLQDMTRDRRGILNSYDSECHNLRLTGHVSLDAILVYMQKKADANHIIFECRHTPETIDYLLTKISEDDLTHLLSDLMENAIISMRKQGNGRLQITFGKLQKEAYISIADSGIPFDIATLHSFGLQPHTTHKDSGGSGIGLMDIWKIKRKYRATIQIQEYEKHSTNFTKRILFSFNAKNHYVIQSFRHAEISNTQTRGDLYIIPAETKEKNEGKKHERNTENLNS